MAIKVYRKMKKTNLLKKMLKDRLSIFDKASVSLVNNQVRVSYKAEFCPMLPSVVITIVANMCDALGATFYIDKDLQFICYYNERVS
jgi:hypothetical protein